MQDKFVLPMPSSKRRISAGTLSINSHGARAGGCTINIAYYIHASKECIHLKIQRRITGLVEFDKKAS